MTEQGPAVPGPESTPLDVMMAYLGVRETKPNRGPWIDKCLRFVGLNPELGSFPWCAASLVWCCDQAGVYLLRTPSVSRLWNAVQGRRIMAAEPGCGFVHLKPDGTGHCGLVTTLNADGTVGTISGNTNAEGSREGDRVGLHDKPFSYFEGFFHVRRKQ